LVAAGNDMLDNGFVLSPAGWTCRVAEPIDTAFVTDAFDLPGNVEVSADRDTVFDRLTWCAIEGPGARLTHGQH
jgi:hypothetical protein